MRQPIMFAHVCDVVAETNLIRYQVIRTMFWGTESKRAGALQFCGQSSCSIFRLGPSIVVRCFECESSEESVLARVHSYVFKKSVHLKKKSHYIGILCYFFTDSCIPNDKYLCASLFPFPSQIML